MPAFEQAMRRLDAPSTPSERVACYEVLTAAADRDPATRARVAEFCLARAGAETDRDPDDSWSPVLAACDALIQLDGQRVKPIIQQRIAQAVSDDRRDEWKALLDWMERAASLDDDCEWRTD